MPITPAGAAEAAGVGMLGGHRDYSPVTGRFAEVS
ncbi:hypothetical protein SacxiDRAFT_3713 [Saccharomonospora xinjiangensis XJ-54]|uniref:Uncharacterized protein n=1 Tax=Saccharomonospora xinjiangensis XJ-54 TaxID=882086 RepID=I0V703_9PSEU|nr:hypothetical protein SacxiDRAFT_3713 [Saccharomonospora xinjiangensis XJ-54]